MNRRIKRRHWDATGTNNKNHTFVISISSLVLANPWEKILVYWMLLLWRKLYKPGKSVQDLHSSQSFLDTDTVLGPWYKGSDCKNLLLVCAWHRKRKWMFSKRLQSSLFHSDSNPQVFLDMPYMHLHSFIFLKCHFSVTYTYGCFSPSLCKQRLCDIGS